MQEFQIGDKVRFLNDVGGGTVSGFQKGGVVLVEDEDGFDIPMLSSEIVLISKSEKILTRGSDTHSTVQKQAQKPVEKAANTIAALTSAAKKDEHTPEKTRQIIPDPEKNTPSLEERIAYLEATVKRLTLRIHQLEDAKAIRERVKSDSITVRQDKRLHKDEILEVDLHATEILDTTAGMSAGDIKDYQLKVFRDTMQQHLRDKGRKIVFIHGNGDGVLRQAILSELKHSYKQCQWQDASFQQYGFGATMVTIK